MEVVLKGEIVGITLTADGSYDGTTKWVEGLLEADYTAIFDDAGQRGLDALVAFTPKESGLTAESWGYEVIESGGRTRIEWFNENINQGVPIAIIIQYGHGTGTGGYVSGIDYINPALAPVFDTILYDLLKEVSR